MTGYLKRARRKSRVVEIGGVSIGGAHPVVVQSMTNTKTADVPATLKQTRRLANAGSQIVRVSVPDEDSAQALKSIVKRSPVPIIADIHFDYRLALKALEAGASGLRINPGNIHKRWQVETLASEAADRRVPIRVGANAGSLRKDLLKKHKGKAAQALVQSALEQVRILEDLDFYDIKVSLKSSDVLTTVDAYRIMAEQVEYPLHIGITEAGTRFSGAVRSAVGLGILLEEGIGDTIRVSLAADPVEEVRVAYEILRGLGLWQRGVELIACPTCSRAEFDVIKVADELERRLMNIQKPIRIAVMGCIVNGPGEAAHADIGAVGTPKGVQIYLKGKRIDTVKKAGVLKALLDLAKSSSDEK
jgi:(E)-4-hydroxy-3-methylbut-2-enyl-diphosphate synthase